ncbi:hypothetical protein SAY87_017101 [Trapa incisa]|uniref:Uncharacterized protein n=1 Tax=Trapa incisa TaxID=236973 RepID=A0AAN7QYL9_9MYRT|nr:hypothetical protein SAY87_017101 [Trapa incisa]
MEMEGEDSSSVQLRAGSEVIFGRGSGFCTDDRTVSRRHVLLRAGDGLTEAVKASFEVLGKNPVWVSSGGNVRVYRTSEKGDLAAGDWLCVSGRQPIWFAVKVIDSLKDLGSESEVEAESLLHVPESDIDPVKEFGFLVIGHEFDQYPKQMFRKVKDWNWFLEEHKKDNSEEDEDDEDEKRKSKPEKRTKRKKFGRKIENEEDEDWTGESEEEKQDLVKPAKAREKMYITRSKGRSLPSKRTKGGEEKSAQERASSWGDRDDVEEDEEDETLGGFIVKDDNGEEEEEGGGGDLKEEEEEEEFIEDDEED